MRIINSDDIIDDINITTSPVNIITRRDNKVVVELWHYQNDPNDSDDLRQILIQVNDVQIDDVDDNFIRFRIDDRIDNAIDIIEKKAITALSEILTKCKIEGGFSYSSITKGTQMFLRKEYDDYNPTILLDDDDVKRNIAPHEIPLLCFSSIIIEVLDISLDCEKSHIMTDYRLRVAKCKSVARPVRHRISDPSLIVEPEVNTCSGENNDNSESFVDILDDSEDADGEDVEDGECNDADGEDEDGEDEDCEDEDCEDEEVGDRLSLLVKKARDTERRNSQSKIDRIKEAQAKRAEKLRAERALKMKNNVKRKRPSRQTIDEETDNDNDDDVDVVDEADVDGEVEEGNDVEGDGEGDGEDDGEDDPEVTGDE